MAETTEKYCEKLKRKISTIKGFRTRTINKITENLEKEETETTSIEVEELYEQ